MSPHDAFDRKSGEADRAAPRFWGPASWWRLGLLAMAALIVLAWLLR